MSLINQMLQDLEARRATQVTGVLPSAVRPLPAPHAPRGPRRLVWGGAMLVALAAAVWSLVAAWPNVHAVLPGLGAADAPPAVSAADPPPPHAQAPVAVSAVPSPIPASASVAVPAPAASVEPSVSEAAGEPLRLSEQLQLSPASETVQASPEVAPSRPRQASSAGSAPVRGEGEKNAKATPAPRASSARAPSEMNGKELRHAPVASSVAAEAAISRNVAQPSSRDRAEADYRQAIAAINQGRLDEGTRHLRTALQHDALHVPARQLLVRLLLEARQTEAAMQSLAEGLEVLPAQTGWAMSLGRLHVERGDYAAAWSVLQHSEPAASGNADYQGFAGHILQRLGRPQEAAAYYRRALRSAPDDGRWWLGLGLALEAEGRVDEARDAWQTARRSGKLTPDLLRLVEQKLK